MGRGLDLLFDPLFYLAPGAVQLQRDGANGINLRERNLETIEQLQRSSIDLYAATRTLVRQHRGDEVRNGAPAPLEDIYDEDLYQFDPPKDREARGSPGNPAAAK